LHFSPTTHRPTPWLQLFLSGFLPWPGFPTAAGPPAKAGAEALIRFMQRKRTLALPIRTVLAFIIRDFKVAMGTFAHTCSAISRLQERIPLPPELLLFSRYINSLMPYALIAVPLCLTQACQITKPLDNLFPFLPAIFNSNCAHRPIGTIHDPERSKRGEDDHEVRLKSHKYLIHRRRFERFRHLGETAAELHVSFAALAELEHCRSPCDKLRVGLVID
jgi:hypothetical protein